MTRMGFNGLGALGLTAKGPRSIGSGVAYEKYFDLSQVKGKEVELKDGDVYDTLELMHRMVRETLSQTRKISDRLKGATRTQTCKNIWDFLYNNIQYKKDVATREQLRTPVRSWRDRKAGIDCDCFSIFAASILTNLKIPFAFRMAGYGGDFQHVYVVVPASGSTISEDRSSYIVIDPVIDAFDKEQPFKKKDDSMKTTMLNGPGDAGDANACPVPVTAFTVRHFIPTQAIWDYGYIPTLQFLQANKIAFRQGIDEKTNGGVFVIKTACGERAIPPVLSKEQSEQVKAQAVTAEQMAVQDMKQAIAPGEPTGFINKLGKKVPWGWLAAGVVAGALVFGGGKKKAETTTT